MGRKPRVDRTPEEKWQIIQEGIKSRNVSETCRGAFATSIRPREQVIFAVMKILS
jgi:hypothetical protein